LILQVGLLIIYPYLLGDECSLSDDSPSSGLAPMRIFNPTGGKPQRFQKPLGFITSRQFAQCRWVFPLVGFPLKKPERSIKGNFLIKFVEIFHPAGAG